MKQSLEFDVKDFEGKLLLKAGANLSWADLSRADLSWADLSKADLSKAIGAGLAVAQTRILPEGDLIGWKKCQERVVVKLLVSARAKRSHAFGRKCRASYVRVLAVIGAKEGISRYDTNTVYRVGKIVRCDMWEEDWTIECAGGIHFFTTREEAEAYES